MLGLVFFNAISDLAPIGMPHGGPLGIPTCVTQSISLSNIIPLLLAEEPSPEARETQPSGELLRLSACFLIAATFDGGDQETANEMVELTGIEPVTSCLQSTRSPN